MAKETPITQSDQVLQYIIRYNTAQDGNSPTLREIMAACQINATSSARASCPTPSKDLEES